MIIEQGSPSPVRGVTSLMSVGADEATAFDYWEAAERALVVAAAVALVGGSQKNAKLAGILAFGLQLLKR